MIKHHINTGCHYDKHGQLITIVINDSRRQAYFHDHSRSVHGLVEGACLEVKSVMRAYIYDLHHGGEFDWLSYADQMDIDRNHPEPEEFEDWSYDYKIWIMGA